MLKLFKRKKEIETLFKVNEKYLDEIKELEEKINTLLHENGILKQEVQKQKELVSIEKDKVKEVLKVKKEESIEKKKKWLGGFYGEEYGKQ